MVNPETPDIGARGFSAMGADLADYPWRAHWGRGGFFYCLRRAYYLLCIPIWGI